MSATASALRTSPAGVLAGAPLSRIRGHVQALALVGPELAQAELALRELIQSDVAQVPAVAGYLAEAGGKRLRPALTALGARAVGFDRSVSRLMCAGELIHLGSLLHDDVVDEALTRRGRPAAHQVHGNATTILTGDFCLARAVWLAAVEGGHAAVTALAEAVTEMAEGEVLQLVRAGDLDCGFDQYLEVVQRKSAALIAWCAAAGAYAQDDAASAAALVRYGRAVGVAFQITDDVLDFAGGTGKDAGADLRERKVTLPLLHAMSLRPDLRARLSEGPLHDAELPHWIDVVRGSGALPAALADARRFLDDGLDALTELPDNDGRQALEALGHYLVERAL